MSTTRTTTNAGDRRDTMENRTERGKLFLGAHGNCSSRSRDHRQLLQDPSASGSNSSTRYPRPRVCTRRTRLQAALRNLSLPLKPPPNLRLAFLPQSQSLSQLFCSQPNSSKCAYLQRAGTGLLQPGTSKSGPSL